MKLCHLLWTSPKLGLKYQKYLLYLLEILWYISDLPFFQREEYQYSVSHLDIVKYI